MVDQCKVDLDSDKIDNESNAISGGVVIGIDKMWTVYKT